MSAIPLVLLGLVPVAENISERMEKSNQVREEREFDKYADSLYQPLTMGTVYKYPKQEKRISSRFKLGQ